jgi:hypothetical protein
MHSSLLRFLTLPRLAFAILFLWILFAIELHDPDYFWHLKAGEYILANGFPSGDPFSFTFQGKPWVLHEWLFEVGLYALFAGLGPLGVKMLTALLGTASAYIVYAAANRVLNESTLALGLTIASFAFITLGFAPRPQLLTYVLFAAFLYLLVSFKYFEDDRFLWSIPPVMILWVNSHGGYVVGLVLLALFASCEWLMYWLRRKGDLPHRRRLVKLSLIFILATLTTALNPDFVRHWLYPFQVMNMSFANSIITEWQSPNFHALSAKILLLLVFGFFVVCVYRKSKPDLTEIALPCFFLFAGFVSIRHVPLAMLTLIPFGAVAVRDGEIQRLYARVAGRGKELGNAEYVMNWTLLAVCCIALLISYPIKQAKQDLNSRIPIKATEFIRDHGITGRVFNEYGHGGYLIYSLYPRQQVFIDGRADVFGDEFLKEYMAIRNGAPDWEQLFDKYDFNYVIIPRSVAIRQLLLVRGDFKSVYEDKYNSVLVRNSPKFADLIASSAQ